MTRDPELPNGYQDADFEMRELYAAGARSSRGDKAMRRLRAGAVVLMFPEATRTRDGSIGRLQAGPMTVAARAGVPVMPVVIDGAFEAWPRARFLPRPHPIRVACGRPIPAAEVAAGDPKRLMAAVRREMLELQAELRRK